MSLFVRSAGSGAEQYSARPGVEVKLGMERLMLVSSVPTGRSLAGDDMGCNGLPFSSNFTQ